MGKGSSPPAAPDPYTTAAAQMGLNADQIRLLSNYNQPNQISPGGSLTYEVGPDGRITQTNKLSPEAQAQYDLQQKNTLGQGSLLSALLGNMDPSAIGKGVDFSKLPQMLGAGSLPYQQLQQVSGQGLPGMMGFSSLVNQPGQQVDANGLPIQRVDASGLPGIQTSVGGADAAARDQTINSLYGQMKSRLDPQWKQATNEQEQQLFDRGITQDSNPAAFGQSMDALKRQQADAYQGAQNAAIQAGGQEQSRLFDIGLQQGQFGNNANQQALMQKLGLAGFNNQSTQQDLMQRLGITGFNNALGDTAFNRSLSGAGLQNQTAAQSLAQMLGIAGFNNQAIGQNFGQALSGANLQNNMQNQAYNQYAQQQMAPLQQLAMLLGGSSTMMPAYSQYGQVNTGGAPNMGDLVNNNYQGQLNAYNANVGQQNQTMSTVGSLAMMAAVM